MDMLLGSGENVSYTQNVQTLDLYETGSRVVKAFGTRHRFFHFEFFRLDENKEGLGLKGDLLGLEVNMRAPGGYIPPTDVADLWRFIDERPYWSAETHGLKRVSVSCGRDFQHLAAINNPGIANDFTVSLINLSPTSSGTIKIQGNIP